MQGPSFGVGVGPGGRLRVNYAGGDFHPGSLWRAVVSGKGYHKPRLFGGALLGLAVVFAVINYILLAVLDFGYPYFVALVPPFFLGGLWMVIAGQPLATQDESPSPMWGRIGLAVGLGLGLAGGLVLVFLIW